MPQMGRERRRTDLYGRARRFVYGLLLLAASPGAMAADELAALGQHRAVAPPVASASGRAVLATLQGLIMVHAERSIGPDTPLQDQHGYPRVALDTISARLPEATESPLFRVAVSEGYALRDGLGFDLAVPDLGNFHLNLYTRRNARTGGERWALTDATIPDQAWTLGGTLELVRTIDGEKHVAFVPELRIDLSDAPAHYLPFQASLKLAHWRSLAEKQSLDERVPQLTFKWRL